MQLAHLFNCIVVELRPIASLEMKYIYYEIVDWLLMLVIIFLPIVIIVALLAFQFCYLSSAQRSVHPNNNERLKKKIERAKKITKFQIQFAKSFFGDWVIDSEERDGRLMILLFKKPFPMWTLTIVTIEQIIIIAYIAAIFINALLVERSYNCDQTQVGFDCFFYYEDVGVRHLADPINCSNYSNTDGLFVYCCKFNFNFPVAAALAGGLMEFFPLLFTVPLFIIIKLANGNKCRRCGTYILQWIALLTILFCCVMVTGKNGIRYYIMGIQIFDYFTYVALFSTTLSVLIMPWSLAIRRLSNSDKHKSELMEREIDNIVTTNSSYL